MTSIKGFNQPVLRAASAGGGANLTPSVDMNALMGTSGVQPGSTGWQSTNYSQTGIQGTPYGAGSGMASFLDGLNGVMSPTANAVTEAQGLYQKQQARKAAGLSATAPSAADASSMGPANPDALGKLQDLFGQLQTLLGGSGASSTGGSSVGGLDYGSSPNVNAAEDGANETTKAPEDGETGGEPADDSTSLEQRLQEGPVKLKHSDIDKLDFTKLMKLGKDDAIKAIKNIQFYDGGKDDKDTVTKADKDRLAVSFTVAADNKFADKLGYDHDNLEDRDFSADDLHVIRDLAKRCGQRGFGDSIDEINNNRREIASAGHGDISKGNFPFAPVYLHREDLTALQPELKGKNTLKKAVHDNPVWLQI